MIKRVFVFLLSFFFFIGGTLATAQAASVEAVNLSSDLVDDSGISLTSINTDDGSSSFTFTTISFYSNSGLISSLSNITTYSAMTVPAGTSYFTLLFPLSAYNFNGISNITLSSRSWAGYDISNLIVSVRANSSQNYTSIDTIKIFDDVLTDSFQFELYYSSVNYVLLYCYLDTTVSSSLTMYTPDISFTTGSSDFDLEETNNLISASNGLLSNIWSSITELPQQIINLFISAMQSLFIPSDDYFTTKFNELYVLFDEKLGFLMYPTEVFSSFVDALQASSDGFTIDFPAFSLDVGGASYQVWEEYVFNFDDVKSNFPEIFSAAEIIFTVILCGYSINLIITYYDVVVWGSSSTALVDQGGHDDY